MLGETISHYKILELIGEGGMGQVWRATDTKLNRDVALKILPEQFASDSQRMGRFQREAEVLASLDHPNIGQIYGIEEAGQTKALVLQLIEGPTLAERIAQGPIPVEETLKIALQIAEGLEAAHEKGVIHRDLKPANIKINPEGQVKILDFGLAKALEGEAPDSSLSQSPTLTNAATQAGVILGTAAYMSPEQARGETTDKKADVWAFGCVLFEMLTRQATFGGKTVSDVLAGVLRIDPEWKSLPPNLHPRIRLLLERSLEKESKDRYHDIADARVDIQKALADPSGVAQPTGDVVQVQPRRILPWVLAGAVLSAVTAGVAVWSVISPAPPRLARFAISESPNVSFNTRSAPSVTISPDGTRIVYVGPGNQLYVRAVDQLDAVALRGGVGLNPFISPDGNWVGFLGPGDALKKVSIHGGPPVVLSERMGGIAGASWGADDSIIFGTFNANGLFRVSAAGGEEREPLTNLEEGESGHRWPEILPGGRTVVFTVAKGERNDFEIAALNLETGERKVLFPGGSNPHYASTGHIVYGLDGTLRAVPFDLDAVEVKGDPVPVLEGVVTQPRGDAHFSLAEDGTLVYVPGAGGTIGEQLTFVWVDREGREETVAAEPRAYQNFSLSPDGTKIAVQIQSSPENIDVWIYDLVRDTQMRLTFDPGVEAFPIWTPDGQRVAFGSNDAPLSWKAADGTGQVETLVESSSNQFPQAFSADGTTLVFQDRSSHLGMLSLEGERISTPLLGTEFLELNAALSPDGRWMAYESNELGQLEVYVRPFPDVTGGRWQVSSGDGGWPLWSPEGRELFYVGSEGMMAVTIETEPTFTQGTVNQLFDLSPYWRPPGGVTGRMIDISPEGDRFLMLKAAGGSDKTAETTSIIVVQNWFEELKERVPTDN